MQYLSLSLKMAKMTEYILFVVYRLRLIAVINPFFLVLLKPLLKK